MHLRLVVGSALVTGLSLTACTSAPSTGPSSSPPSARSSAPSTAQSSSSIAPSTSEPSKPADPSTATSSSILGAAFVRRANAICAAGNAYGRSHAFPVAHFDPTDPAPAQLPKVARYLRAGPDVVARLSGLDAPTRGRAEWRKIVVVLRQEHKNQAAQIQAAQTSDPQVFSHTAQDASVIEQQLLAAARAHGLAQAGDCLTYFGG